ncbi:RluA family pseudouridine synthase [Gracilinema caldarium]|uniref:RluA family pseudouridine synthase n=1 Tax=Gracilinema caldarium TaxID=215591 RepID=UPI0026EC50AC|nr:RluA family pseudouridine synthase [Gracilinema caldarium]
MKHIEPFSILYENDRFLVVNKASGIAVIADRWDDSKERLDELLNAYYAKEAGEAASAVPPREPRTPFPHRVYVVHRIDRDTSGLVLFAKTKEAHRDLSSLFESRSIEKTYLAVIHGRPGWTETVCDLPLRADGDREHRTVIDKAKGKHALTHFKLLAEVGAYSLIQAQIETGRTHQIRVHLASLGHPVVCDPLYGNTKPVYLSAFKRGWRGDSMEEKPLLARLGLHAYSLVLPEGTSAIRSFTAPLPRDFRALVNQMEKALGTALNLE